MTTVAFDGKTMASDTLATDAWGMKEEVRDKVREGQNFLMGAAGSSGEIVKWWEAVKEMPLAMVLSYGFPDYEDGKNDPAIILTDGKEIWRHVSGVFLKCSRPFHAVGSGRDYALAAMHLGKTAREAVEVAMTFDNGTGGEVVEFMID